LCHRANFQLGRKGRSSISHRRITSTRPFFSCPRLLPGFLFGSDRYQTGSIVCHDSPSSFQRPLLPFFSQPGRTLETNESRARTRGDKCATSARAGDIHGAKRNRVPLRGLISARRASRTGPAHFRNAVHWSRVRFRRRQADKRTSLRRSACSAAPPKIFTAPRPSPSLRRARSLSDDALVLLPRRTCPALPPPSSSRGRTRADLTSGE